MSSVSLYEFLPAVSPNLKPPKHLAPLVDLLDQAEQAAGGNAEPVFACVSVPPQHGKTETILHRLALWLKRRPSDNLAYISYGSTMAESKSRKARRYAKLAGIELIDDTRSVKSWQTVDGGGLIARGIEGAITGAEGLRLIVIDDPYKNREAAESATIRRKIWEEFESSILSRLHPTTSVIINHTRWHMDDLIGRLCTEGSKWQRVNLPALNEEGEALWPEGQPAKHLNELRQSVGEYAWYSLWMGEPRPRGDQLFGVPSFYEELPERYKIAIGIDLAYTAKERSDYSVAVVMAERHGEFYIIDMIRKQVGAPQWAQELKELARRYKGAPMRVYIGGTEKGLADVFRQTYRIFTLHDIPATKDKFLRAQPVSAAWNRGIVHLPQDGTWVNDLVDEVKRFTGLNDDHDDVVDAMAAAFDVLNEGKGSRAHELPPNLRDEFRNKGPGNWERGNRW